MRLSFLISLVFAYFLTGCSNTNKKELANKIKSQAASNLPFEVVPAGKPKVTFLNPDSLKITPANGKLINIKEPITKRNPLARIPAGSPKFTLIDHAQIFTITPGEDGIPLPQIYALPDSGYSVQHSDTILAPQTNIAFQPFPSPSQSLRFKDAAVYNIQYLDVEQGMASSYVNCIYEDDTGNIWLGTYGGGVSKYDGKSFTTFTIKEGLPGNVIWSIIDDKNGNLWFGTEGSGVSKYDGNTFTNYNTTQGLANDYILTMTEDNKGNLWFGTDGGGVSKLTLNEEGSKDCDSFMTYTKKQGLLSNEIWTSLQDNSGNLWFGTNNGLSKFDGVSFTNFTMENGLPHNRIRSLYEDGKGNLWVGTEGGVSIYDGKSFNNYTKNEGLVNNRIWSILEDNFGNIWLASYGGGFCKLGLGESQGPNDLFFTHYTEKEGLSYDFIIDMKQDNTGNFWFGTDGGGVSVFNEKSFTSFTNEESLNGHAVWSIFEDKEGNLWFGTEAWGLRKYKNGNFTTYMDQGGLLEYPAMSILQDKNDDIWFATDGGGVVKYDGNSFLSFTEEEGLSNNSIYSILEDKNGNIWFAIHGVGLIKYDGNSFTTIGEKDGLPNDRIWTIIEDSKGYLWIGTYGDGVSKYDGKSFTTYTVDEGLLHNSVNSILEDEEGNLWFATDEGISKLVYGQNDNASVDSFYNFTTANGLSNNIALSLVEDNDHNIWVGTEGGITLISSLSITEDNLNQDYQISTFVKLDGLKGLDAVINSVCLDIQKQLWWGTGKGISMLDLENLKLNNEAPRIQLNGIGIGQDHIDYRRLDNTQYRETLNIGDELLEAIDSIKPFYNYPQHLSLPHNLNHISFAFSAIDWVAPHKIKYQYKLKGLDDKWTSSSADITAEYRNLDYGDYTFSVRTIGSANQWSHPLNYSFEILKPWWNTLGARLLYLIIALLLVFSFDRWRTLQLLQKQKVLEKTIEERTSDLEERNHEVSAQAEELITLNEDLENRVKNRTEEIQFKNDQLIRYSFSHAHKVRGPLARIMGLINLIDIDKDIDPYDVINKIKDESTDMDEIVKKISDELNEAAKETQKDDKDKPKT